MKIGLKLKLMAAFFLLISLPLSLLGVLSYNLSSRSLEAAIEQQLKHETALTAKAVENTIGTAERLVQLAAHNQVLLELALKDEEQTRSEAYKYLVGVQAQNNGVFETLVLTDNKGKGIMSHDSKTFNTDLSDREYMKKALAGTEDVSSVIVSRVSGQPVVAVAYPIKVANRVAAVLVGTVKFSNITSQVAEVKIGENGYAYMIDKTGLLVYHPRTEKVLSENLSESKSPELRGLVEKMKNHEVGSGFYTYDGVYKYVSFHPAGNWVVAVTANYDEYMEAAFEIRNYTVIIVLASILAAMLIAYFFSSSNIIKPVLQLQALMVRAGEGDLTVKAEIKTKDEMQVLGEAFNNMIERQAGIVRQVRSGAQELAASSEETAAASEQISASAQQVSASIQEVATGAQKQNDHIVDVSKVLVQLSSLVQLAQNKAVLASNNSMNALETAGQGRSKVNETIQAIDVISKSAADTGEIIQVLNELSSKVGGIINTINSIAEQTNLLALNAAIEAARAGEHGRGFTVVAEEVRKLSDQSNAGAREIATLVREMIRNTELAVNSIANGKMAVENGVKVAGETDEAFVAIMSAAQQIAASIEEIVDITKDEVATSDQVIKLIDTIATITETTSANSQEVSAAVEEQTATTETLAASAEEASAMAGSLEQLVKIFKIGG